jgi:hypothetical protein
MRKHIDGLLAEKRRRGPAITIAPDELTGVDHG